MKPAAQDMRFSAAATEAQESSRQFVVRVEDTHERYRPAANDIEQPMPAPVRKDDEISPRDQAALRN